MEITGKISYSSRRADTAKVSWFCDILSDRIIRSRLNSLHLSYGTGEKTKFSDRKLNIYIPRKQRSFDEMSLVFDKISQGTPWIKADDSIIEADIDLISFALWILNREEETLQCDNSDCWDREGRFLLCKSLAYRKGQWKRPVLDLLLVQLIKVMEEKIGFPLLRRKPWGERGEMAVWATHDVDRLMIKYGLLLKLPVWLFFAAKQLVRGNKENGRYWLRKCFRNLKSREDSIYESIQKLAELEKEHRLKSTYFFMGLRRGISWGERLRYPISHPKAKNLLRHLVGDGNEIGLHPGRYKPFDKGHLINQQRNLEHALGKTVNVLRNHHLLVHYPDSWKMAEACGVSVCSNVGWRSGNGFRAGTCWPYHPFDIHADRQLNILEIPMIYMDNANDAKSEIVREVLSLANEVSLVHGVLTINFHTHIFETFDLSSKGAAYKDLLEGLKKYNFLNTEDIVGNLWNVNNAC